MWPCKRQPVLNGSQLPGALELFNIAQKIWALRLVNTVQFEQFLTAHLPFCGPLSAHTQLQLLDRSTQLSDLNTQHPQPQQR